MLSEQKMSMKLLLIGAVLLIAAVKGEYFYSVFPKKGKRSFKNGLNYIIENFIFARLYCFGHAAHVNRKFYGFKGLRGRGMSCVVGFPIFRRVEGARTTLNFFFSPL
jgi:hypothetical protein